MPGVWGADSAVKERPLVRLKDLPAVGAAGRAVVAEASAGCAGRRCARGGRSPRPRTAVRPRARVTERLRDQVATAIAAEPGRLRGRRRVRRVVADRAQGADRGGRAVAAGAGSRPSRLGIDETRFRSVRWILDGITWKRSDPWLTSFVDCSRDGPGSLLGLAPGRTGGCVKEWLGEQTEAFRTAIEIGGDRPVRAVRLRDPSRAAGREDRGRQVASGRARQQMVTEVRQRVTRDLLGRRGTAADPVWVNRRLLLTGAEHLSAKQWRRLHAHARRANDPTKEIGAAWAVKERLRMLLARARAVEDPVAAGRLLRGRDRRPPARNDPTRRHDRTWWPAILVALTDGVTNARTEGFNRIIKQTKRVGCGYRNMINYQRRILTHIAVTRPQRSAA